MITAVKILKYRSARPTSMGTINRFHSCAHTNNYCHCQRTCELWCRIIIKHIFIKSSLHRNLFNFDCTKVIKESVGPDSFTLNQMADRNLKLLGKVALITGAGAGIGAETARLFTKLGATVSLLDLDENNLKAVAAECEKLITNKEQQKPLLSFGSVTDIEVRKKYVENTVKTFSKIDILVNNAGVTKYASLLESSLEDYDRIFDINVKAVLHMTQLAAPHLIKTKGNVVNLASIAGQSVMGGRLYYGMSKACVKHFTKYAAEELAKYGVRVNSVSPGCINTNIFLSYKITKEQLPEYLEQTGKKHALSRCGEPYEVAEMIAFLSSDEASFVTGADYLVDGGFMVQPAASGEVVH